ncbi:MAG: hypothetical protein M3324_00495, partial [Actinomycetota bacterium]|nr:hypothetical protein [Actinomycetota bacterium]
MVGTDADARISLTGTKRGRVDHPPTPVLSYSGDPIARGQRSLLGGQVFARLHMVFVALPLFSGATP